MKHCSTSHLTMMTKIYFLGKPTILTLNLTRSSYRRSNTSGGNGISMRVKKIGLRISVLIF